jgi:hypothetical protein
MGWIRVGRDASAAELAVVAPNTISAEVACDGDGASLMCRVRPGSYAVLGEDGAVFGQDAAAFDGTVTAVDLQAFTVTVETRGL